ncbi:MAG: hypothetical protein F4X02_18035 [Chloroflexi bacterium]|nr:hypothetical protein [Chloroflexota bacterium]
MKAVRDKRNWGNPGDLGPSGIPGCLRAKAKNCSAEESNPLVIEQPIDVNVGAKCRRVYDRQKSNTISVGKRHKCHQGINEHAVQHKERVICQRDAVRVEDQVGVKAIGLASKDLFSVPDVPELDKYVHPDSVWDPKNVCSEYKRDRGECRNQQKYCSYDDKVPVSPEYHEHTR